ncbi:MAG TPA: SURF1 family protein [Steroidobacteraceae bacterium]
MRFAPRALPTVAAIVAALAFSALGNWQLGRAQEKRALAADFARETPAIDLRALAGDAPRYQRVIAHGSYDNERQFLLDNMSHAGQAGVLVLTALRLADGSAVLVNRGWLPLDPAREALPEVAVTAGPRTVSGRLDDLPRPTIRLDAPQAGGWPRLVQYPRIEELSAMFGRELHPRVILLDAALPDGYVREWAVPGATPDRHLGYAVQWFAFAALAVAIWIALGLQRDGESP